MTIADFLPRFLELHVARMKSSRQVQRFVDLYLSRLGRFRLDTLRRFDVVDWHKDIGLVEKKPQSANRALSLLRLLYTCALDWGIYDGPNPAQGVKHFPRIPRTCHLHPGEEMGRFLEALEHERPAIKAYFLLLLFTVSRLGESCRLRWTDIDEQGIWRKPMTKNGKPQSIPIPSEALKLIQALPRTGEWVFITKFGTHWHESQVQIHFQRIRARAGMENIRVHDLKRTAIIWLKRRKTPDQLIKDCANHASIKTTERFYLHGDQDMDAMREVLEQQAQDMQQNQKKLY